MRGRGVATREPRWAWERGKGPRSLRSLMCVQWVRWLRDRAASRRKEVVSVCALCRCAGVEWTVGRCGWRLAGCDRRTAVAKGAAPVLSRQDFYQTSNQLCIDHVI